MAPRNCSRGSPSSCSSCCCRAASSAAFWKPCSRVRERSPGGGWGPDMLAIEKLSVSYGRVQALCEVDLEIHDDGVLHGVIGPNGAGKSTLLDAVCGRRPPPPGRGRAR